MNFEALGERAEALIRQNGQEMTLVCVAQETPSAETGLPAETESATPFFGVWDTLGKHGEEGTAEAGDAVVWAAGLNIPDPSIVDRVECGQEHFRVLKLESIRGGGTRLLHRFILQRM